MTTLDWRSAEHHALRAEKCVHCGFKTRLRNEVHRPSHKVCAETALTDEQKASRP